MLKKQRLFRRVASLSVVVLMTVILFSIPASAATTWTFDGEYTFVDHPDFSVFTERTFGISGGFTYTGNPNTMTGFGFEESTGCWRVYIDNNPNSGWANLYNPSNAGGIFFQGKVIVFDNFVVDVDSTLYSFLAENCANYDGAWYEPPNLPANVIAGIVGGFNGLIGGLGNGVAHYFESLFLAPDGGPTTFATVSLILLGASFAIGIARKIIQKV